MEENRISAPETEAELNEILRIRREKLAALKAAGKDPYQKVKYDRTALSADIKADYDRFENQTVGIAGRLVGKRVMGKASFAVILDGKGTIQSYLSVNDLGEDYAAFKDYDIGDIIGITGFVFKTRTGEISVHAKSVRSSTDSKTKTRDIAREKSI